MSPDRIEQIMSPYNVFTVVPYNSDKSINKVGIRFKTNLVDCNKIVDLISTFLFRAKVVFV